MVLVQVRIPLANAEQQRCDPREPPDPSQISMPQLPEKGRLAKELHLLHTQVAREVVSESAGTFKLPVRELGRTR